MTKTDSSVLAAMTVITNHQTADYEAIDHQFELICNGNKVENKVMLGCPA